MRALRHVLLGLAALGVCAAGAARAQTVTGTAFFPIVIEAPSYADKTGAKEGELVYRQTLRPLGAIRSKAAFVVHFTPRYRRDFDLSVPAGTVFVAMFLGKDQFFCAAQSEENSFWDYYEIAVCLRDNDRDGIADQQFAVQRYPHRLRSIFELQGEFKDVALQAATVAYEKVEDANMPRLELGFLLYHFGGLVNKKQPTVSLQICTPPELTVTLAHQDEDRLCAQSDWLTAGIQSENLGRHFDIVKLDASNQARVEWGPIAFSFQLAPDWTVTTKVIAALPAGPAILYDRGEMSRGADFANEIPIFHLQHVQFVPDGSPTTQGTP